MRKQPWIIGSIVMLALAISACSTTLQTPPPEEPTAFLFTHLQAGEELSSQGVSMLTALQEESTTAHVGIVDVHLETLQTGAEVNLNVSAGTTLRLSGDQIEVRAEDNFTWFAEGSDLMDHAILVVDGNDLVGSIRAEGRLYQVRPLGNGLHALIEFDESRFDLHPGGRHDHGDHDHTASENLTVEIGPAAIQPALIDLEEIIAPVPAALGNDGVDLHPSLAGLDEEGLALLEGLTADLAPQNTGMIIDVLVAYTASAKSKAGNIDALIRLAIDETNLSFQRSGVETRVRLAHAYQTNYASSGSAATDTARLQHKSDNYMDEVHKRRNQHRGDVVILLTGSGGCGYASVIRAQASTAFASVRHDCSSGNYAFGHEIGHLMGARHNPEADPTNTPFAYGHGYYNRSADWRTMMSYPCSNGKNNCPPMLFWSTPSRVYAGQRMGTGSRHNNARVLDLTAYAVSRFRTTNSSDAVWWGNANRTFTGTLTSVTGRYDPITGDFDGNGREDIFWYRAGSGTDYIWWGRADRTFGGSRTAVNGRYDPITGDFNGDGREDIFWYRAGSGTDYIWWGRADRTFGGSRVAVNGRYDPVSGDFNGDGRDDVFWYSAGSGIDYIWWGNANKTFGGSRTVVNGFYQVVAGDLNGDGRDDIFWYRLGSDVDYIWWGNANKSFGGSRTSVGGTYNPIGGDFNGDGRGDIFWYRAGSDVDYIWWGNGNKSFGGTSLNVYGDYDPVSGDFDGDGRDDIFWYQPR